MSGEIVWPPKTSTAEDVVKDLDLKGRYFVVTGSNTGIGQETVRVLSGRGAHVVMACRNMEKAQSAKDKILAEKADSILELMELDLASLGSVEAFAAAYKAKGWPLHVLILNAGLYAPPETHTKDGYETTFQVNHLAQMYLCTLLLEVLKTSAPARVVVVSSMAHKQAPMWGPADFAKEEELSKAASTGGITPMRIYGVTKLCNVLFAKEWDRRHGPDGVRAFSLHPGVIDTEFGRNSSFVGFFSKTIGRLLKVPIPRGAATQTFVATAPHLESMGGQYFDCCHPAAVTGAARNMESAAKLWETSEAMVAKWKSTKA